MFKVVCDVAKDGDGHDEETELDLFYLVIEVVEGSSFEDFVDFLLFLLLLCSFDVDFVFLAFGLTSANAFCDLPGDFSVAVVDDLDEELSALIDGCSVEHENFEDVADDSFVIDGEVDFQ